MVALLKLCCIVGVQVHFYRTDVTMELSHCYHFKEIGLTVSLNGNLGMSEREVFTSSLKNASVPSVPK